MFLLAGPRVAEANPSSVSKQAWRPFARAEKRSPRHPVSTIYSTPRRQMLSVRDGSGDPEARRYCRHCFLEWERSLHNRHINTSATEGWRIAVAIGSPQGESNPCLRREMAGHFTPVRDSKCEPCDGRSWEVSGAQSGCAVRSGGDLPGKAIGTLSNITC